MGARGLPAVIAHRGSSLRAPENTLAAFRRAVAEGAGVVELDCRLARDGELVVIHDGTLRRTGGIRARVRDLPGAALAAVDVGAWFSARHAGETIPLLATVLHDLPPSVGLMIELKSDPFRPRRALFVRRLARLLHRHAGSRPVMVCSFDHRLLRLLAAHAPRLPLGALHLPVRDTGRRPSTHRARFGARWFICSVAQLRVRMVRDARDAGMQTACYTVNTAAQLRRAVDAGVDAVITDDPAGILARLRA